MGKCIDTGSISFFYTLVLCNLPHPFTQKE
jgi:hypothetical protein